MGDFMNLLLDQTLLSILGLLVGFIGILVSIIVSVRSRIRVEPYILFENIPELTKLSEANRKITVNYAERVVGQVTTTRVWFLNKGKRPLKRDDIPTNDPLSIEILNPKDVQTEVEILDFAVLKVSKQSSNFYLIPSQSKRTLKLDFDYVDSQEGVLFEIQHTGLTKCELKLNGVILGPKSVPKILLGSYTQKYLAQKNTKQTANILNFLFPYFGAVIFAMLVSLPDEPRITDTISSFKNFFPNLLLESGVDSLKIYDITNKVVKHYDVHPNQGKIITFLVIIFALIAGAQAIHYLIQGQKRIPPDLSPG